MRLLSLRLFSLAVILLSLSITTLAAVPFERGLTPTPTPNQPRLMREPTLTPSSPVGQTASLLQPGRIYEGNYFGEPVEFQFDAELGQLFVLEVMTDDFDAVLAITDPSGIEVALDDDSGTGNMPMLIFVAPSTNRFTVTLSGYSTSAEGSYILHVTSAVQALEYDVPLVTEIDGSSSTLYGFEAAVGDVVNIIASSGDSVDTTLRLIGPDGREVAYIDDFSGIDPELRRLQLAQDGRYVVIHAPYNTSASGDVTLLLERTEYIVLSADPIIITFSEQQTRDIYALNAEAGRLYIVTVTSADIIDGSMQIQDPGGMTVGSTNMYDVLGASLFFRAEVDGVYRLTLDSYPSTVDLPIKLYLSVRGIAE